MRCEAPFHVEGCNGIGETVDHHTPRCIAKKVLGWTESQVNAPENIQRLSVACHRHKDKDTPARLELARLQKQGKIDVPFGMYEKLLKTVLFRKKEKKAKPKHKRVTIYSRR